MKSRIIRWEPMLGELRYLPQWWNGHSWHWYIAHDDSGSPYLHYASFATLQKARDFIRRGPDIGNSKVEEEIPG